MGLLSNPQGLLTKGPLNRVNRVLNAANDLSNGRDTRSRSSGRGPSPQPDPRLRNLEGRRAAAAAAASSSSSTQPSREQDVQHDEYNQPYNNPQQRQPPSPQPSYYPQQQQQQQHQQPQNYQQQQHPPPTHPQQQQYHSQQQQFQQQQSYYTHDPTDSYEDPTMMRTRPSASMQKTYDDCYLICSTAVYFEAQNNEAEALRSWRSALDQIYYHNAYRMPAGWVPRSETERALKDSLRAMEVQCKERVDLLEALRQSREEAAAAADGSNESNGKITKKPTSARPSLEAENQERREGYIGGGTVPAINYPELSKPSPPLPQRPAPPSKHNSLERVPVGRNQSYSSVHPGPSNSIYQNPSDPMLSPNIPPSAASSIGLVSQPNQEPPRTSTRSASPEKGRTMRQTLRTGDNKSGKHSSSKRPSARKSDVTNKAATLAWQAQRRPKDDHHHSSDSHRDSNASLASTRTASLTSASTRPPQSPYLPPYPNPSGSTAVSMPDPLSNDLERNPPTPQLGAPKISPPTYPTYLREYPEASARKIRPSDIPARRRPAQPTKVDDEETVRTARKPVTANSSSPRKEPIRRGAAPARQPNLSADLDLSSQSVDDDTNSSSGPAPPRRKLKQKQKQKEDAILADLPVLSGEESDNPGNSKVKTEWEIKVEGLMKNLPKGVDDSAAKQIFNEIVIQGDEVHWDDVAGLDIAKTALKEAVVYPFLRPDLFMGLREPARGMLLFGPPGTGKTMLARAVATESRSTFFSISASSLTSKYLGESEKLVRALFSLAKALAPSIIFVDEIDSLLSTRSGSGENEATRRIKTEFLIQWSDLQRAAAGREQSDKDKERGDASRVLVLAATNLPWAIDEAARRRFVRRQYIPLPEDETRATQLRTLLGHQKHSLKEEDIDHLVDLTDGFSGSDITALAKDAAMGPLRSLGEALLSMSMDQIRPIQLTDFQASLVNIRPSVSKQGLKEFEDWAREFGERGG